MDTNFENALNQLNLANPASSSARGQRVVPNFAKINKTRSVRQLSIGLALFACIAIPTAASIATRGGNETTVQFADGSFDGLKGTAKKSSQTVSFAGAPSLELGALPTELIGADQNFRTSRDGFSFPNYGGKPTNDEIDATTMAALFGKAAVCADQNAALCVMVPGAQAVADQLNEAMASGRCEGMSVLAQRFYDGLEARPNGAASTAQITQDQVAKQIGYWWATQVAPPVAANSKLYRAMTPSQVTTELVKGLKDRAGLTLGLYSSFGGHSVNPIAVTKDGTNFNIYVYDNNYPSEIRKVVVNPTTESWTYGAAALNSSSAASTWTGSGAGSFDLTTMASRQGPFKVSLGSTKGVKGTSYSVIVTQQGNTTEPVGFKLTSRFGVVNSLDNKSVSNANFPIKSFLGAGVGQGAIAFIPTVFAEESGLELEIVGGDKDGKYTVSVMRAGAAGVVVESKSKFDLSVSNSALDTDFGIDLLNPTDKALVQLSSGNSGTDIQLTNGQSIEVSTSVMDDDAFKGSRRIEYPVSVFEVSSWDGKVLVSENVETKLLKGQVQKVNFSVDSGTGVVSREVVEVKGVKVDDKFIKSTVPSVSKASFDKPTTKPNAKFIEALQPIQLPTRAIAGTTTTSLAPIQLPTRAIAVTTTTSVPSTTNPPAPDSPSTPTTTLPAQEIVVTVRAQRYYGSENTSIAVGDWSVVSCQDSNTAERTGCSIVEDLIKATPLNELMEMNVSVDQMADVKSYSSTTSDDLSAVMNPVSSMPSNYTAEIIVELEVVKRPLLVTVDSKQSKVYGEVDQTFTFKTDGLMNDADLTGALSRETGEIVNTYSITQGTLDAGLNYIISFTGDTFAITPKTLTVTAGDVSKTYGDVDPEFTYLAPELEAGDTLAGSLDREVGEDVGTYAIGLGSLANSNYAITFNSDDFTITAKSLTITADAGQTKIYGVTPDPTLTYTTSGLVNGDTAAVLTGGLTRATGENVDAYAISSSLANPNYAITFIPADFTITKKDASVTPAVNSKTYGDGEPTLVGTLSGFVDSDNVTATFGRVGGETVADSPYTISATLNPAAVLGNYNITYNTANFTITAKPLTITADAGQTKIYGVTPDPTLTYKTIGLVKGAEGALSGGLTRATGENVDAYAISSSLANPNYAITFIPADFTITKKDASVTPAVNSKTYGDGEPTLVGTLSGFVDSDNVTATYGRVGGETVADSPYTISATLSPAAVLGNYNITYNTANFTITAKPLTITAVAKSKIYGDADPTLTYTTSGLANRETAAVLTGSLARAVGEDVGTHAINRGTLANSNYAITFTPANLTIGAKPITVTAAAKSKTYGDADPVFTFTAGEGDLVRGDALTGVSVARISGESVGTYAIAQGSVTAGSNYTISYVPANLTITAKALTVTANAVSKTFGETDPPLTFTTIGLISESDLTGSLTRVPGGDIGTYAIEIGSLSATSNYTLSFIGNTLTINAKSIDVVVSAGSPTLVGSTTQATATSESSGAVTWTASPSNNCSISASGVVTGLKAGNCTITANVGASGNYQAGVGSTTIVIEAVRANCGGGNGGDANTPGCTGGGRNETETSSLAADVPATSEEPSTTTEPETTTTTTEPETTTTTTEPEATTTTVTPTTTDSKGKPTK